MVSPTSLNQSSLNQSSLNQSPIELPIAQVHEFLPPLSAWVKFGGFIIVGTFGGAIALSSIAHYKITVKGEAMIRPTGELRVVQAATEGMVLKIAVTENQTVHRGDVIATIDDSQLQTKKRQLQTSRQQAELQIIQINAQISALIHQMDAETIRSQRAIAQSEATIEQRMREHQDRQVTTATQVEAATAKLKSAQAALNTAQLKWVRYSPLAETGAIPKDHLEEALLAVQQQEQQVAAAQAEVENAQAALNPTHAEVEIATEQMAQAKASGNVAIATLNKEKESLIQQRIQIQNQLAQDLQSLKQIEIDLTKTTIKATEDGIIAKLNLRNVNQTVASGQEIAKIVPKDAKLIIKALVASHEIDKVKVGQKTQLRVSACPYPDYGTLNGKVTSIAADTTTPSAQNSDTTTPNSNPNPGPSGYVVVIEPEQLVLKQHNQTCPIQLGMEGQLDIISKEETVLQWLLRKARFISNV